MPIQNDDMPAYYAARAAEYDRIYAKPERQADLRRIEAWLPEVFAGRSVLELACGTGYWTQFIAPAAAHVLGVDAAVETLEIAKARTANRGVDFIVGDVYRLPVAAQAHDAGFAGFWLSHVPLDRLAAFFDEFHRTLRPVSRVVLLDNRFVEGSSTPIAQRDADGNTYQLRPLQDGSTHRILKNFPTEAQLRAAVGGAAASIRWHEWTHFWALEYVLKAAS
jgi:demethylmenaquinone methyltransferase/2-methoxy-6-polyprenyl-1,4-benzoquinol methylase